MEDIENSFDLYRMLFGYDLLKKSPPNWWPNAFTFEVVVGAILTQNTRFDKVLISLDNLKSLNALSIQGLAHIDIDIVQEAIIPSGLYRQKAKYIKKLAVAIHETFGNFDTFVNDVTRAWLLEQKGVGLETADAILNYACDKEAMVVDAYTARLLKRIGFEFEAYEDIQAWLVEGVVENKSAIEALHGASMTYAQIYRIFHAMIVEFSKLKR